MLKIPKYIENSLNKISDYERKQRLELKKFEEWVRHNVDEGFDFDRLRAGEKYAYLSDNTNEELTEIEAGGIPNIAVIEEVLNYYIENDLHDEE